MIQTEAAEHPGLILKQRFLDPLGISSSDLAKNIGVSTRRVSELVKGRRRLSPELAHRLAIYFEVPALWFLEMQARFDAQQGLSNQNRCYPTRTWGQRKGILITPNGVLDLGPPMPKTIQTLMVHVSDELLDRLRREAQHSKRTANRTPKIITLPDGTPILTGE